MSEQREVGVEHDSVAQRLSSARRRRGWSREVLAVRSGVSWSAIAQIEGGRRQHLRPGTASALASALGVTIDYLLTGGTAAPMMDHRALLYATDDALLDAALPYLTGAVERGEAAIAVMSAANVGALREGLGTVARQVDLVERTGWYTTPADALRRHGSYMQERLDGGAPWVSIMGELPLAYESPVPSSAWARYESLLNAVFANVPATLLCTYDMRAVDDVTVAFVCATHPRTHGAEAATASVADAYVEPVEFLTRP